MWLSEKLKVMALAIIIMLSLNLLIQSCVPRVSSEPEIYKITVVDWGTVGGSYENKSYGPFYWVKMSNNDLCYRQGSQMSCIGGAK